MTSPTFLDHDVELRNGTQEPAMLVRCVQKALRSLLAEKPLDFHELVQCCRHEGHDWFGDTAERLQHRGLVQNGEVHGSIRNIVLASVEGDEGDMHLVNPHAESVGRP